MRDNPGPLTPTERQQIQVRLGQAAFAAGPCSEWYVEDVGRLVRLADQQATRIKTLERNLGQHLRGGA